MPDHNIKALLIADCYPESNKRGFYIDDPKLVAALIKHLHDQNPKELLIFGGIEGKMTATDEEQLNRLYPVPAEPKEEAKAEPAKSSEISASSRSFFGSTTTRQAKDEPDPKPVGV